MIYVYTNKQDSENWILQNDWYFNLYTGNEKFTEEDKAVICSWSRAGHVPADSQNEA